MAKSDKVTTSNMTLVFENLMPEDQKTVYQFAQFLAEKNPNKEGLVLHPLGIERPAVEKVVAAIKRLRANYPMIQRKTVFHDASSLMTQHIMEARPATDVIDELETLFADEYEKFKVEHDL